MVTSSDYSRDAIVRILAATIKKAEEGDKYDCPNLPAYMPIAQASLEVLEKIGVVNIMTPMGDADNRKDEAVSAQAVGASLTTITRAAAIEKVATKLMASWDWEESRTPTNISLAAIDILSPHLNLVGE